MSNVDDARYRKSEERIQNALGELLSTKTLADVSVSELTRKANVSRATFYSHYDNVGNVFDQLVTKTLSDVRPFEDRFQCNAEPCRESESIPYCERIRSRDDKPWGDVARDAQFFPSMMLALSNTEPPSFDAVSLNVSKGVARGATPVPNERMPRRSHFAYGGERLLAHRTRGAGCLYRGRS